MSGNMVDAFLRDVERRRGRSRDTLKNYRCGLAHFSGDIDSWTWRDLDEWNVAHSDVWEACRHVYLSILSVYYEWCKCEGHRNDNPVKDLPRARRPRKCKTTVKAFSWATIKKILAVKAIDYYHRRRILLQHEHCIRHILVLTGMRVGAAMALHADDIDLARGIITIRRAKGGEPRQLAILRGMEPEIPDLTPTLRAYLREMRGKPLFEDCGANEDTRTGWARVLIKRIGAAAGITQRIHPHLFRHSLASYLLARGVEIQIVSAHLGHENISTTVDIYGHIGPEAARDRIAAVIARVG